MPIVADAAAAVRADLGPFKKDLAGVGKETDKLGKKMSTALNPKNLFGGFAAAFAGSQVIGFMSDATNAAAEFADSLQASGVIFGDDMIPQMEEWGETAAENFGASKREALAAANVIATLGKSAGLAGQDLVDFSQEMVQLGGDLASMFGGTTQDAITAVGAALRGESEPIRRYGVLLDDATLRQKAFELGLISTTKNALTPQQRVLAAQASILEQTSDAQGDFARTSDGMANTQRELAAEFDNLQVEIGEKLLPVMLELATWVKNEGIPLLTEFIDLLDFGDEESAQGIPILEQIEGFLNSGGESAVRLRAKITGEFDEIQQVAEAMGISWIEAHGLINRAMEDTGNDFATTVDGILVKAETLQGVGDSLAQGIVRGRDKAAEEAALLGDAIVDPITTATGEVVEEVENMYAEIAAEMKAREDQLRTAGGNAIDAWLDPQLTGFKISAVESELASQELKDNLASQDPAIVADAKQRTLELTAELISLKNEAATQGDQTAQISKTQSLLASQFMEDGLKSKDPEIRELFRAWKLAAETHLGSISASAYPWGYQVGDELARGMWDSLHLISDAAYAMSNEVKKFGPAVESEPKYHGNPLRGITKWGGNIVKTIADGMYGELGMSSRAAAALSTSLVPGLPSASLAGGVNPQAVGMGRTYIVNVNGVQRTVKSEEEAMQALRDLGAFNEGRLN